MVRSKGRIVHSCVEGNFIRQTIKKALHPVRVRTHYTCLLMTPS